MSMQAQASPDPVLGSGARRDAPNRMRKPRYPFPKNETKGKKPSQVTPRLAQPFSPAPSTPPPAGAPPAPGAGAGAGPAPAPGSA